MNNRLLFLLPRDRNTGLNNVMRLLARQFDAPVKFVDRGRGYRIVHSLDLLFALRRAKKEGRCVHSSGLVPDVLNRLSGRNGSSTTVHNFLASDYTAQYGKVKGMVATYLHTWALRGINKVLGCSAAVSQILEERYGIHSSTCLNGCSDYKVTAKVFDDDRCYYFAGPLIPRKQVDLAAAAICENDPQGQFRVFGDGPELGRLHAAMSTRPHDLFIRSVDCPAAYYAPGQFYISFSRFEGMPLGVLEALKQGLIPVLSNISPHVEAIQALGISELRTFNDASTGVLWAVGLTEDDRIDLANRIRQQALSVFSEYAFARRFTKCLFEN